MKKTCEGIGEVINVKTRKGQCINSIIKNESITSDASQMAKHFNEHFCDITKTIFKKIPPPKTTFKDYLKNHSAKSLFINPVTTDEVEPHFKRLENYKAIGPNSIPTSIFKIFKKSLSIQFTDLINMSFRQGKLPQA